MSTPNHRPALTVRVLVTRMWVTEQCPRQVHDIFQSSDLIQNPRVPKVFYLAISNRTYQCCSPAAAGYMLQGRLTAKSRIKCLSGLGVSHIFSEAFPAQYRLVTFTSPLSRSAKPGDLFCCPSCRSRLQEDKPWNLPLVALQQSKSKLRMWLARIPQMTVVRVARSLPYPPMWGKSGGGGCCAVGGQERLNRTLRSLGIFIDRLDIPIGLLYSGCFIRGMSCGCVRRPWNGIILFIRVKVPNHTMRNRGTDEYRQRWYNAV